MTFYSQVGQDKFVCEFFNYKRNGYFLDIGAFDGVIFSNTLYLEKELGWSGVCVEAGSENFKKLVTIRGRSLNVAITDEDKMVKFKENWTVGSISNEGTEVCGLTFKTLLSHFKIPKVIDYISLDIEGSEYDALIKFPFKSYKVTLWTIEHNSHLDGGVMKEKIRKLMLKNGYKIVTQKPIEAGFEDWYYDNN